MLLRAYLSQELIMVYLSRIHIYPVKSLDMVSVKSACVLSSGALANDRRFAIIDELGQYVNGKRNARVHLLRSDYNPASNELSLATDAGAQLTTFHVDEERDALEQWLSAFFGMPVSFRENPSAGFPDDTDSPGPTVISTATLREVSKWFGFTLDQARARFRANLEIDGVPPFWEDQLYGVRGTTVRFSVGDILFDGINPCQRCIVPARDQATGANIPDFAKRFVEMRKLYFPEWAESARFNHFYRLAVNTRLVATSSDLKLTIGDSVNIIGLMGEPEKIAASATANTRSRWSGPLRVVSVTRNTPTVRTFRLASMEGDELPFTYLPGQFLNIELMIDGVLHRRCYTIASTPSRPGCCEITVKREETGTVSSFLHDHVREGMELEVFGPGGRFTFAEDDADTLVLIGAGVGITPLMSKLRYLTDTKWPGSIRLLYCARSEPEIIFKEELNSLAESFPNLTVTTTLTREPSGPWTGLRGRITMDLLRRTLPVAARMRVHICGPVEMASEIKGMLHEIGVPAEQIRAEAFGGAKTAAIVTSNNSGPAIGTVTFADSGKSESLYSGQTVLEIASRAGVGIDRGCMEGICGRCKVRLLSGEVIMEEDEALDIGERDNGFILACQAKPVGSVAIDA